MKEVKETREQGHKIGVELRNFWRKIVKNRIDLVVFVTLVFISHALLPWLSPYRDFIFFAKWNMFSNFAPAQARDLLVGDENPRFLFRDLRERAKASMNIHSLFFLTNFGRDEELQRRFATQIRILCQCEKIERVFLDGDAYQHLVLKENLQVVKRSQIQ